MREPSKGLTRELQVGIFIFAACLVIAAFSFRITDTPIFRKGTTLTTYLDDATGVFKNSKVKMAGIDIGVIKEISLEGGKARIRMLINEGVEIPDDAQVIPRPLGILGDKYLEVVIPEESKGAPANKDSSKIEFLPKDKKSGAGVSLIEILVPKSWAQSGDEKVASGEAASNEAAPVSSPSTEEATKKKKKKAEILKEGQVIKAVNAPATLDDLTRQMGTVGEDLKAISGTLRKVIEDDEQPNTPVGRTIKNAEKLSANMNAVLLENRKDLREMISSLNRVSRKLETAMETFDERKVRNDIKRMADAVGNMNESVENVKKITARIESGEGTVGKLINDPTTAVELNRTLRSINQIVDRAARTQTIIDFTTEYNFKPEASKTYVGLSILPSEDSGYLAQAVIDATGTTKTIVTRKIVDGGTETVTEEVINDQSQLRFSLQYYKRIYQLSLRLGLFENTGGLAADLHFFQDQLLLGSELFNFSRVNDRPYLKSYARVSFLTYFYATVGGEDLMARDPSRRGVYAGVGLRFVDDDLKILGIVPRVN